MGIIHAIPGRVEVEWDPGARAIIDHWSALALVSLADFRATVLDKGLVHARSHQGQAWIVDNSKAKGAFSQEIQAFIGSDVFPAFHRAHIRFFLTVASGDSPLANMSAKTYQSKLGPNGIQLVEVPSVAEALRWIKEHA
jgi:hypothetical protein